MRHMDEGAEMKPKEMKMIEAVRNWTADAFGLPQNGKLLNLHAFVSSTWYSNNS